MNKMNKNSLSLIGKELVYLPNNLRLSEIKSVILFNNNFISIPEIQSFSQLVNLDMSHNYVKQIDKDIILLNRLEELNLSYNLISFIHPNISYLSNIIKLDLSNNNINSIPQELGQLLSLKELKLYRNNISHIPESIYNLTKLEYLNLSYNIITRVSSKINNLNNLINLNIGHNSITNIPKLFNLVSLQDINMVNNKIISLPDISTLTNLTNIYISHNNITKIPDNINQTKKLQQLVIYKNPIEYNMWELIKLYPVKYITGLKESIDRAYNNIINLNFYLTPSIYPSLTYDIKNIIFTINVIGGLPNDLLFIVMKYVIEYKYRLFLSP